MSRFMLCVLLAAVTAVAVAQTGDEAYEAAMARCEEAKQKGDYPTMAEAIRQALKHGPGSEYAWRSLAWALMLSGEWEDSLAVARENVARNGASGWSLEQLAESEMAAGDWAAARATLARIDLLPADTLGSAAEAIQGTRRRLLDLTGQRRYRLHWQVDLGQGGPDQPPARLLMPRWGDPRQTFEFTVRNAVSYERVSEGPRDFIDVVQKPGEPFDIDATVTIRGFALGHAALDRATTFTVPPDLASCLTPFRHGETFDPASPLCARIAAFSKSVTMARTVQNLLDWMHRNMKYADTQNRTLDEILAGGEGVCHHQCSSFAALCRAAGVPARVAHGVVLDGEGAFTDNAGSHGWASVYIDTLGWVPVEPLDHTSLALFGRSNYLLTDYANETPEDHHFDHRSIQGFHCDGEVLAIEPQE
jgi:tetratricopeptide (TPR) repeat protein